MKKIFTLLVWGLSLITTISALPEPYHSLNPVLPFEGHGWYGGMNPTDNGYKIEKLCKEHKVRNIVEVGCWLGSSTRHFATLVGPEGKVYAIDHWLGSSEHQPGESCWHPALSYLYEQFLSNVIHTRLENIIVPIRIVSLGMGFPAVNWKKIFVINF